MPSILTVVSFNSTIPMVLDVSTMPGNITDTADGGMTGDQLNALGVNSLLLSQSGFTDVTQPPGVNGSCVSRALSHYSYLHLP